MSIQGQSFNGPFGTGAHIDFGIGTAGMDDVFKSDHTIAVLEKGTSANRGLLGAFADTSATSIVREFFNTNNGGGRLFGDGDFSNGYPSSTDLPGGTNDNVWRWSYQGKATGAAHYKHGVGVLSTLAWTQGESVGAGNHNDATNSAVMLSTWAIYPNGFASQDLAVIVVWPTLLSEADLRASCTQALADVYAVSSPLWLVSFKQSEASGTIVDLTGGGADETSRSFITTSSDPPSFDFSLSPPNTFDATQFFPYFS